MLNGKKVVGIICECNPFHAGHKRLVKEALKRGDFLIAVMSGNFVQRGEPAVSNKYDRTKKLLKNGIDLVIELPVEYVLSSAKYFASAGVKILDSLNFVDYVIFGSKIADINKLSKYADLNIKNENDFSIKNNLKAGDTYSKAISKIYDAKLSSNDILAIEYIAALKKLKSKIVPITIERKNDLKTASELRKNMKLHITNNSFSDILNYKILLAKNNIIDLSKNYLVTNDLYNSILNIKDTNLSLDKMSAVLKTKNRTLSNIKRVLLNIVLDIKSSNVINPLLKPKYIRILGVKKTFLQYLKFIKVPYLLSFAPSSYKSFIKNFKNSKEVTFNKKEGFNLSPSILTNIFASNLYYSFSNCAISESEQKVVIYE